MRLEITILTGEVKETDNMYRTSVHFEDESCTDDTHIPRKKLK